MLPGEVACALLSSVRRRDGHFSGRLLCDLVRSRAAEVVRKLDEAQGGAERHHCRRGSGWNSSPVSKASHCCWLISHPSVTRQDTGAMQPTSRLDALEQPAAKRTRSDVPSGKAGVPLDEELSNSRNAPAAGGDVVDLTADSEDEQAEATDAAFRAELARFTAQQEEWQRQQRAAAPVAVGRPAGAAAARGRGPAANAPLPPALYADIKKAADEGLDVLSVRPQTPRPTSSLSVHSLI